MSKYLEFIKGVLAKASDNRACDLASKTYEKHRKYVENLSEDQKENFKKLEDAALMMLQAVGENPEREGLIATPFRVAKMMFGETLSGYGASLEEVANSASFEGCEKGNIVLVKDITFFSTCEHHMMPFFGKAHVAYLPDKKVLGLSKIPRVVKLASKKLQLQENLGQEIANAIQAASGAKATCVILESEKHMCVSMRGVEDASSKTVTIATAGPTEGWCLDRNEFVATVQQMIK